MHQTCHYSTDDASSHVQASRSIHTVLLVIITMSDFKLTIKGLRPNRNQTNVVPINTLDETDVKAAVCLRVDTLCLSPGGKLVLNYTTL